MPTAAELMALGQLQQPQAQSRASRLLFPGAGLQGRGAEPRMFLPHEEYVRASDEFNPGYNQQWAPAVEPSRGWKPPGQPQYQTLPTNTFGVANENGADDTTFLSAMPRERLLELLRKIPMGTY